MYLPDPFDPHEPSSNEHPTDCGCQDCAPPFDPLAEHHPAEVLAYSLSRKGYHCDAVVMRSGEVRLVFETEIGCRGAERYLTGYSEMGVERDGLVLRLRVEERRAA